MGKVLAEKYELKELIGEGGSSIVYLAWDRHLERSVAIKCGKFPEEENPDLLRKEMEILKSLKHPLLPAVYDYFCEEKIYLVMEYIQGISLHNYIEKEGVISEEQSCEWGLQLLELFSYLHGQKPPIIYRDLKPKNIIVCSDGKLRLVDFGAAFCFHHDKRIPDQLAGTMGYAAPEQFDEKDIGVSCVDERSDIYTFGATLYHMLTGFDPSMPPYGVRPVRCMNPALTMRIERIVQKCTEPELSKRYSSVEEIKNDIRHRNALGRRHLFSGIGKKNPSVIRKIEKKLWLTEKKSKGLFGLGILLCGILFADSFLSVRGKELPLPVVVYNTQGQKLVIRYDSIYTPEGNLLFELDQKLFSKEGIQKLSVSLTDCTTGEMRERVFYLGSVDEN